MSETRSELLVVRCWFVPLTPDKACPEMGAVFLHSDRSFHEIPFLTLIWRFFSGTSLAYDSV